jgi:hypothetical protein
VSYQLTGVLLARRIPFAFVSAADPNTLPAALQMHPFVRKPFHPAAVVQCCESLWATATLAPHGSVRAAVESQEKM